MKEELSNTTAASEFKAYREAMEAKLAAALAREKALREVLGSMSCTCETPLHSNGHYDYCNKQRAFNACTSVVKPPRVYTAEELQPFLDLAKGIDTYLKVAAYYELDEYAGEVIAHARDIGLLNDERKEKV